MKVLVTGAAGCVGCALDPKLLEAGHTSMRPQSPRAILPGGLDAA